MKTAQTAVSAQTVREQHPDRELLAAAGDFHRMRAEGKAFWKVTKDDPGNKHADAFNQPDGLWIRIGDAVQRGPIYPPPRPRGYARKRLFLRR